MHYIGKQHDKKVTQFLANWSQETGEPIPVKDGPSPPKKVRLCDLDIIKFISCNCPSTFF
jgi:hypothetical protein